MTSGLDARMQNVVREGMEILSTSNWTEFDMQHVIERAQALWAELGEEEATAQVLALEDTMEEGEAAMMQQFVDLVEAETAGEEREALMAERDLPNAYDPEEEHLRAEEARRDGERERQAAINYLHQLHAEHAEPSEVDKAATEELTAAERMQQLIREGMAVLLSNSSDFFCSEMQAVVEKAHSLWAELGEVEAAAEMLALRDTLEEGEAAVLQHMADMVVERRERDERERLEREKEERDRREREEREELERGREEKRRRERIEKEKREEKETKELERKRKEEEEKIRLAAAEERKREKEV